MNRNVYYAADLQDVKKALSAEEKPTITAKLSFLTAKIKIFCMNLVLASLHRLMFKDSKPQNIESIVVYSVGILGDNAVRLPAIIALKKAFPTAKLTVVNKYQSWNPDVPRELFSNVREIDDIRMVKYNPVQRKGWKFVCNRSEIGPLTCDLFVNLSPFGARGWFGAVVREMILAKKLGAKYAGEFRMYSVLNTEKINPLLHQLADINYSTLPQKILNRFGINIDYTTEVFHPSAKAKNPLQETLRKSGISDRPYAILHPGSALPCQRWPAERFGEIAEYLHRRYGLQSVVTGVDSEKDIARKVVMSSAGYAIDLAGKTTLSETIVLTRRAKVVISNDTGMLHLATVQNIPSVGIFGTRENPVWWFPLGKRKCTVFAFSEDSLRYNDDNLISDLLKIEPVDVQKAIDCVMSDDSSQKRGTKH